MVEVSRDHEMMKNATYIPFLQSSKTIIVYSGYCKDHIVHILGKYYTDVTNMNVVVHTEADVKDTEGQTIMAHPCLRSPKCGIK